MCSGKTRVAMRGDAIARDHHERVGQCLPDGTVGNDEEHHGGPLAAQAHKARRGQPFTGGRVQDVVIGDPQALLPAGIEHR